MNRALHEGIRVRILPSGDSLPATPGDSVYHLLASNGIETGGVCGGAGTCRKCMVQFVDPIPAACPIEQEHLPSSLLEDGWRLSCRHVIWTDTVIHIPTADRVEQRPCSPTSRSPSEGLIRLRTLALGGLAQPSNGMPQWLGSGSEPAWLDPRASHGAALALDIGTTSLVGQLVDVQSQRILATATTRNPQSRHGADVMTRIRYAQENARDNTRELCDLLHGGIADILAQLEHDTTVSGHHIVRAVIVGNPTMLHLFLGICPRSLGRSPYEPVFSDRIILRARDAGIPIRPDARIDILPGISGFVGADVVSGILATELGCRQDGPKLLIDLGTNGELALWTGDTMLVTSTAAGPAFEAASISCGMQATAGAIDHAWIQEKDLMYSVVGNGTPRGLCGSGLVEAVAACCRLGWVNAGGRIAPPSNNRPHRVVGSGRDARIILVGDAIALTQNDIHELQLAKAAIRAGLEALLSRAGVRVEDLSQFTIAGALGTNLNLESLLDIGLLPASAKHAEIITPGNTACAGAVDTIRTPDHLQRADRIALTACAIELSTDPTFRRGFARHMCLRRQ